MVVAIFATYPVQLFPIISMAEQSFLAKSQRQDKHWVFEWKRNGVRTALVVTTSLVAIAIPHFSLFISLVGAVGCSLMGFILPCIFHLKLFQARRSMFQRVVNIILTIFGILASLISGTVTVIQLVEAFFPSSDQ